MEQWQFNAHNHAKLVNTKLESTEILEVSFSYSDSNHKKMLLESLNIPLKYTVLAIPEAGEKIFKNSSAYSLNHYYY